MAKLPKENLGVNFSETSDVDAGGPLLASDCIVHEAEASLALARRAEIVARQGEIEKEQHVLAAEHAALAAELALLIKSHAGDWMLPLPIDSNSVDCSSLGSEKPAQLVSGFDKRKLIEAEPTTRRCSASKYD